MLNLFNYQKKKEGDPWSLFAGRNEDSDRALLVRMLLGVEGSLAWLVGRPCTAAAPALWTPRPWPGLALLAVKGEMGESGLCGPQQVLSPRCPVSFVCCSL